MGRRRSRNHLLSPIRRSHPAPEPTTIAPSLPANDHALGCRRAVARGVAGIAIGLPVDDLDAESVTDAVRARFPDVTHRALADAAGAPPPDPGSG